MIDVRGVLAAVFGANRKTQDAMSARWRHISNSELRADVIRLGGLLETVPTNFVAGVPMPIVEPNVIAYQAGRRDLALAILALMDKNSPQDLATIMEDEYDL